MIAALEEYKGDSIGLIAATIEDCQRVVAEMAVEDRWVPVTERLPDKMGQYVCRYIFGKNTDYPFFQVLWYFANLENPHFQHEGSMGLTVTHWMPLPEMPKEGCSL